ncbi:hypothetical protein [Empedobacter tilapiae]|uniref:Uncharacterized protein n=1 Tax=Empedobacter tilapiae TaxID=2491114 RepID=A0A4Z1AVE8_9FLAO|nr:hypothetical protein [Empedobacter tilapiae]TGN23613.1 hypothetical protein E4J94_14260 [Empedobacter tilapiae]
MLKNIIIILVISIFTTVSCQEKRKIHEPINIVNEPIEKINDSLLIGYSKISDIKFIENIHDGGFKYFDIYEEILQNMNKKFINFQKEDTIVEEKLNNIVLRLVKKTIKEDHIEIELQTFKSNKKIASILFYKYQWDENVPDNKQRLECLSYINSDMILWHLETFTNHSEDALGIDGWNKYKINLETGDIKFIEKLEY